jgi:hypothetical protein
MTEASSSLLYGTGFTTVPSPPSPAFNYRFFHIRKLLERASSFAEEDFEPGRENQ